MPQLSTTPVVDAIQRLNISGTVLPMEWFKTILLPSGHPDTIACILLADIIYWYRPTEVRDEETGQIVGYHKRFAADKLQRSSQAFADTFGFTKRQVQDALKRLIAGGYITRELRTITTASGLTLSNVCFIEPVVGKIEELTYPAISDQRRPSYVLTHTLPRFNAHPPTPDVALQETTTGTTTKNIHKKNEEAHEDTPSDEGGAPDARQEVEVKRKPTGGYGNQAINQLIGYLKERLGITRLDGSEQENRRYAHLLIQGEAVGDDPGLEGAKRYVELAAADDFLRPNISSLKDLYYKRTKLQQRAEAQRRAAPRIIDVTQLMKEGF